MKKFKLLAPVEGKVIPIDQVPDPVFSQKMLGDGVAIIPKDGKIYSPIDGTVTNVMDSLHAYSFISDDGVEMIVHFGLETVALNGEGFTAHVKEGDKVKAGDLVCEVDLTFLIEKGIETTTPVVICGGADVAEMDIIYGDVKAKSVIMSTKGADVKEKKYSWRRIRLCERVGMAGYLSFGQGER